VVDGEDLLNDEGEEEVDDDNYGDEYQLVHDSLPLDDNLAALIEDS